MTNSSGQWRLGQRGLTGVNGSPSGCWKTRHNTRTKSRRDRATSGTVTASNRTFKYMLALF